MSWEKVLKFIPERRDDFQKWLKESYNELVKYFKQDTLSRIPKSITKNWGKEEWAALQENAESETKSFIQTVAFDNKIYPKEFLQEEFKNFIRKGEVKKAKTMKTKHKNIVFNGMSDGKWRTIREMERDFNLKEVWPKFNGYALVNYLKNSTGAGARSGVGEEIYDRRKVKKGGYGATGRVSKHVWEFRLKTEMLHKASLINVGSVTLDNRELPEEDDDEKCRDRILRIMDNVVNVENKKRFWVGETDITRVGFSKPKSLLRERIYHIPEDVLCYGLRQFDNLKHDSGQGREQLTKTTKFRSAENNKVYYVKTYKNSYPFRDWLRLEDFEGEEDEDSKTILGKLFHYVETLLEIGRSPRDDLAIRMLHHSSLSWNTKVPRSELRRRPELQKIDTDDYAVHFAEFDTGAKEFLDNIEKEIKNHEEVYA